MTTRRWHRSKAFTLIEILIVVVILGILAAIVIPQFTKASEDAQVGNVQTQLQTIRSQIELYRVKNNGQYPPSVVAGGAGAVAWADLIGVDYLKAPPVNPRTNSSSVALGADHTAGAATDGWIWNDTTKTLYAQFFDEAAASDGDPATNAWTGP
ncbi:MAG: prepilin-type N-terminal cleavage/methylation domain-containing protein [Phycisphaerae bacterium]|nr:prepilin-type N-terminal cleavage/methylation domain-containing protein [Phycisphaerae bacterium]